MISNGVESSSTKVTSSGIGIVCFRSLALLSLPSMSRCSISMHLLMELLQTTVDLDRNAYRQFCFGS